MPVFNEAGIVARALATIDGFLHDRFADYEIIVVESGSTDGTSQICDEVSRSLPRVRVIHEGARRGIGAATRVGYASSVKDLVLLYTVDFPFPLDTMLSALPLFDEHECVLSRRSVDSRGFFRRVQSFVYNRMVKVVLKLPVTHVNSAFKIFKRSTLQRLPLRASTGFIDAETVYWVVQLKVPYVEIPVELVERTEGQSSVSWRSVLRMLRELYTTWSRLRRERRTGVPPQAGGGT